MDERPVQDVAAPPTTLSLVLRGLVVSSDASVSHAIIADGSGGESVYFLQSEVPGGATLVAIQASRVILKRGGVLEALLLPRLADSGSNASAGFAASTGLPASGDLPASPAEVVQPPPARLADIMMPRPHIKGGKFQGVEVFPGERGEDFAGLGLKPGDVVTAIDGRPLSASDAAAPFLGIAESATLTLTINRRGQTRTIKLANGKLVVPPTSKT
jgi:general secretion pathway protein C